MNDERWPQIARVVGGEYRRKLPALRLGARYAAIPGSGITGIADCAHPIETDPRWPVPVTPGARCACGLNRPALPTLLICVLCISTTRCGLGTATRSRALSRWSSGRSSWATRGATTASTSGSRTTVAEPWVRVAHEIRRPFIAHANWLEIGWALRRAF